MSVKSKQEDLRKLIETGRFWKGGPLLLECRNSRCCPRAKKHINAFPKPGIFCQLNRHLDYRLDSQSTSIVLSFYLYRNVSFVGRWRDTVKAYSQFDLKHVSCLSYVFRLT